MNKIDTVEKPELLACHRGLRRGARASPPWCPISARRGEGLDALMDELEKFAAEGPHLFPDDVFTDQPEKQLCAEIIREKLLWCLEREVPHGTAVVVTRFEEREDGVVEIDATIYCEKASHKGIIIGRHGDMLKKIGEMARKDMEALLDAKVYSADLGEGQGELAGLHEPAAELRLHGTVKSAGRFSRPASSFGTQKSLSSELRLFSGGAIRI